VKRLTIFERYDAQVSFKFFHVDPVSNATVWLNLKMIGLLHSLFTPFKSDIRALLQYPSFEIFSLFHLSKIQQRNQFRLLTHALSGPRAVAKTCPFVLRKPFLLAAAE
jgi:hypothetical protein